MTCAVELSPKRMYVGIFAVFLMLAVGTIAHRPSRDDPEDAAPSLVINSTVHSLNEAWRDLLDEIGKLADLSWVGVASNSSSSSSGGSGGGFGLSLNSLNLNEVGLMMVEDVVSRMSQHWRRAVSQDVHINEAAQTSRDPNLSPGERPFLGSLTTVQRAMESIGEADSDGVDAADPEGDINPEAGSLPLARAHYHEIPAADVFDGMEAWLLPPPLDYGAEGDPGGEETSMQSLQLTLGSAMVNSFVTTGSTSTSTSSRTSSSENRVGEGSRRGSRRGRGLLQGPTGGTGGNIMYANAFRLVFGNFFDFVEGARRFIATLAGEARSLLINIHWIRDLAILATAPLDNIINSNWLPLPQSIDQLRSLFQTALNDYCTPESLRPSRLVLGEYRRPTFSLAILPASCTIRVDMDTGRRNIDWERCTPARLRVTITPGSYTGAYYTAPVYTGKFCRFSRAFGTDKTYQTGGGTSNYDFRRSARALFLLPVLNQFFVRGLFTPFVADNLRFGNVTGGPIYDVISVDRPTTADGSNAAFILRTASETAAADARLKKKLIPIRDDEPKRYVPKPHPPRNRGHSGRSAGVVGAPAAGSTAQTATPAATSAAQQRTVEALLQQPQRLQWNQPKPLQPPPSAPAPWDSLTAAVRQAGAAGDVSAQAVVPYHGKRIMAPELADKEAVSSKSGPHPAPKDTGATAVSQHMEMDGVQVEQQSVRLYRVEDKRVATPAASTSSGAVQPAVAAAARPELTTAQPSSGRSMSGGSGRVDDNGSDDGDGSDGSGGGISSVTGRTASSTSATQQYPPAAVTAPAWNLTYTEWLLDVVDRAFVTSGI